MRKALLLKALDHQFFLNISEFNKHIDVSEKNITFLLRKLFFCQSSTLKGQRLQNLNCILFLKILNFKING